MTQTSQLHRVHGRDPLLAAAWNKMKGVPPDRHPKWVRDGEDQGVDYHEALGYRIEVTSEDGLRPATAGNKRLRNGRAITQAGMVLMSCSKEDKARIDAMGQEHIDRIVNQMRGVDEKFTGMQSSHRRFDVYVEAKDSDPTPGQKTAE